MSAGRATPTRSPDAPDSATLDIAWLVKVDDREDELVWTVTILAGADQTPLVRSKAAWCQRGPLGASLANAHLTECGSNLWHLDAPGLFAATLRATPHQLTLLYARSWLLPGHGAVGTSVERPSLRADAGCFRILGGAGHAAEPVIQPVVISARP